MNEYFDVNIQSLKDAVINIFKKLNVSEENASITADVLIAADRRGIASHGVARLRRYVNGIKNGIIKPDVEPTIEKETPTTLLINGNAGLGQVVAYKTMKKVIEKAATNFVSIATVHNSNHYGIAGYYSMMALPDMIGISYTNSAPLVVPTFAKSMAIGTNPMSIAVPTNKEKPYVLDMATSTVPRGKLEVYNRREKNIPLSWAVDENGIPTDNPGKVLKNLLNRAGGGLLPLGGAGEENSGYKGYGLGMMVDIFTGILSGGSFGLNVYGKKQAPPDVCHYFMAINPEAFVSLDELKNNMDEYISMIKKLPKQENQEKIFIAGEKEYENEEKFKTNVSLYHKVYNDIKDIAREIGITINI